MDIYEFRKRGIILEPLDRARCLAHLYTIGSMCSKLHVNDLKTRRTFYIGKL